ncbi:MAG TPA: hypothetical protein V6D02_08220 [Candidatus Obscuribacterales bacterium]
MTHPAPEKVYENLQKLEKADVTRSAVYRQAAVEVLADLDVDVEVRQAIADRLNDANHLMTLRNVDSEDSY